MRPAVRLFSTTPEASRAFVTMLEYSGASYDQPHGSVRGMDVKVYGAKDRELVLAEAKKRRHHVYFQVAGTSGGVTAYRIYFDYIENVRDYGGRPNPDGFWTKGPRPNPGKAHDLVDIVSARTGEVLESRLFRYVAEQNAWLFRHDGNKVRIQKHRPAAKASRKPMRRNPSHGLTPHYEPGMFPRAQYYDDIEIPAGFIAQHYGNDAAPLWIHPGKRLSLWVNAKRSRDREVSGKRFVLGVTNADYEPDPEPILETNSMRELLWTIANHRPGL